MRQHHSDDVLDVVENFADTCPNLKGKRIEFEGRVTGEDETVRTMYFYIDGIKYLVQCKKVDV